MEVKKGFIAQGTTCESCAKIIKKQAMKVEGVKKVTFDLSSESGYVTYDDKIADFDEILSSIEEKNYSCFIMAKSSKKQNTTQNYGWLVAFVGIAVVLYFIYNLVEGVQLPSISQNMGYGLLFIVGLFTGFHCVSMCGGFVVSYTAKNAQEGIKSHKSHMMYGLGKIVSYTIIGAIFGLIGSVFAFTPVMRGVVGLLAGLFLVLFGLKMLNIFPILRKIQLKTPKFIDKFVGKNSKDGSPLIIGLLNGLMIACGPLQAIYIMAAGTGSLIEGAKLLFIFGLGTLPVMIGFGYFASFVSSKVTQKILKISGVVVILLGLLMINNGLVLTGTGYDYNSIAGYVSAAGGNTNQVSEENAPTLTQGFQEIRMDVLKSGFSPNQFVLKKGVPVKWIIDGKELTGCNNAIT